MKTVLVVTTIQGPNAVMMALAAAAAKASAAFVVMGDRKSPLTYDLAGASYTSLDDQYARFGAFAHALPHNHYVRKNLGYLAALELGCDWMVETDDDNFPLANFFQLAQSSMRVRRLSSAATWLNVYRHFSPSHPVWPRGYPLEALATDGAAPEAFAWAEDSPALVQGLADDNPDVDAIYRLTRPLPVRFGAQDPPVSLDAGIWCPFNSQNTWFRRDIAVLAYLPAHCSFRMTDIWRSFVAQRCLWEIGQRLVFTAPSVRQERNEHNLLRDFADEVPGYLNNEKIRRVLTDCKLAGDPGSDLRCCYEALVNASIMPSAELALVDGWLKEVEKRF